MTVRLTRDIYSYIAGDLQEEGLGGEKYNKFVDELNHKIVTLSNSSDVADMKAAVLSIGKPRSVRSATAAKLQNT